MTIAVTGATGQLGRIVITKLKEKVAAADIVALVRSPDKAADLGVTARATDYGKPETLDAALSGVDTLLLISSSEIGQRLVQHQNVIGATKKAGVKKIVYTSVLHADTSPLGLAEEHRQTEAAIQTSGIAYTLLRNGWYSENYKGAIGGALASGTLIGSAGEGRISAATRLDYAEAAVAVLTDDGHDGRTYELAGDNAWTLADLAAEVSKQSGRSIPYKDLPEADYAAALVGNGVPQAVAAMLAGADIATAQGALFDNGRELSSLIGRPTTPLAVAVAEALRG